MGIRRIVYKYVCPNCDNPMYRSVTQIGGEEWVVEIVFVLWAKFECERCGCVVRIPCNAAIVEEWDEDWEEDDDD